MSQQNRRQPKLDQLNEAVALLTQGKITLSEAAKRVGITSEEFLELLSRQGNLARVVRGLSQNLRAAQRTEEDFREELKALEHGSMALHFLNTSRLYGISSAFGQLHRFQHNTTRYLLTTLEQLRHEGTTLQWIAIYVAVLLGVISLSSQIASWFSSMLEVLIYPSWVIGSLLGLGILLILLSIGTRRRRLRLIDEELRGATEDFLTNMKALIKREKEEFERGKHTALALMEVGEVLETLGQEGAKDRLGGPARLAIEKMEEDVQSLSELEKEIDRTLRRLQEKPKRRSPFHLLQATLSRWAEAFKVPKALVLLTLGATSPTLEAFGFETSSVTLTWFTLFLILYDVIAWVGEPILDFPKRSHVGFKLSIILWTIGSALLLIYFALPASTNIAVLFTSVGAFLAALFPAGSLVSRYLWRRSTLLRWQGPAPKLLDFISRGRPKDLHNELKQYIKMRGLLGAFLKALVFFIPGALIYTASFFTAILLTALINVQFLPEVIIILYLLLLFLRERRVRLREALNEAPDLGGSVLQLFEIIRHGVKGISGLFIISLGIAISAGLFYYTFRIFLEMGWQSLPLWAREGVAVLLHPAQALPLFSFVTIGIVMIFSLIYSLWYWVQLARRLPSFLKARVGETETTSVKLPPGLMLPAPLAWASFRLWGNWFEWLSSNSIGLFVLGITTLGWLGGIVLIILRFKRKQPEPLESDNWRLPLVFALQLSSFIPLFPGTAILGITVSLLGTLGFYLAELGGVIEKRFPKYDYLIYYGGIIGLGFAPLIAILLWRYYSHYAALIGGLFILSLALFAIVIEHAIKRRER